MVYLPYIGDLIQQINGSHWSFLTRSLHFSCHFGLNFLIEEGVNFFKKLNCLIRALIRTLVKTRLLTGWQIAKFFYISLYTTPTEKAMAPHSSTLAWKIPWAEEPSRLQPMGSRRVCHDWATSLSLFTFLHWRRKWQPTPVFLPGESQGRWSLVGCHLWGCKESDKTEVT